MGRAGGVTVAPMGSRQVREISGPRPPEGAPSATWACPRCVPISQVPQQVRQECGCRPRGQGSGGVGQPWPLWRDQEPAQRPAAPPGAGPLTVVVVPGQVLRIDEQVVVRVQLPELAVDDVEVLVGEELRQLVDVCLLLQESHVLPDTPQNCQRGLQGAERKQPVQWERAQTPCRGQAGSEQGKLV